MTLRALPIAWVLLAPASFGQKKSIPLEVPFISSNGNVGRVVFRETMKGGLNIDIKVQALSRGEYAVHIHQNPVCDAPDFRTAGAHFNPDVKQHGWKNPKGPHAGDLPENILVDADGNGQINVTVENLNLTPGSTYSVLGRSIVIHERADDMRTDPTGNSGNRIACAVIQSPR